MRGLRARRPWREDGLWPRARQLELEGVAWHCFWRGISRGGGSFGWLAVAQGTTFSDPRALKRRYVSKCSQRRYLSKTEMQFVTMLRP